jgi:hypothetical protein
MDSVRRPLTVRVCALALLCGFCTPGNAWALWPWRYACRNDPSEGYAVPIQAVYQYPAAIVFQPTAPWDYGIQMRQMPLWPGMTAPPGGYAPPRGASVIKITRATLVNSEVASAGAKSTQTAR